MFRFVLAWQPGDDYAPLAANGFVGVETDVTPSDGVPVVGTRPGGVSLGDAVSASDRMPPIAFAANGHFHYRVIGTVTGQPAHVLGEFVRKYVDERFEQARPDQTRVLLENDSSYSNAAALWSFVEAAGRPIVGIALDLATARAAGQAAAVIVPTLNLRIGLVRVRTEQPDLAEYAKRLAGIGFDGYVVLDPPPGPDRVAVAAVWAELFRSVLPAKPLKKAPSKAVKA